MYHRILVPLDGSENAEKVLPIALDEARVHGATIVLLRVIPPLRSSFMVSPKFMEQLTEHATEFTRQYLDELVARLGDQVPLETVILAGPPADQILDYAEESGCDLIIIGSRGETGVSRWRFGSVAQKVVRTHTNMPVLVVST